MIHAKIAMTNRFTIAQNVTLLNTISDTNLCNGAKKSVASAGTNTLWTLACNVWLRFKIAHLKLVALSVTKAAHFL